MKKALLFLLLLTWVAEAYAAHGNKIFMKRPASSWNNLPAAIKDVEIEVTPLGIYAQIDLTFTIGPTSTYNPSDSQEAVIFFELPEGSYVHDSWLWLNPTTIISAELMERRRASEVYAAIVHRRRDPSLLVNVLSQEYQLNIYPASSGYWRKVKISYSTPVRWQGSRANVPLPLDLMAASQTIPDVALKVNSNGLFYNPRFSEREFGAWLKAQSGTSQQLIIPAAGYNSTDLTLSFEHYHTADGRLSTLPVGPNEGIYELIVPPAITPAPRYFNFVIDHQSNQQIYSLQEIRRMVQNLLTTALRPTDFFNVHYYSGPGAVVSLFNTWHAADSAGINGLAPAFGAAGYSTGESTLSSLYKIALQFTAAGPANAETIILNGNGIYLTSTNAALVMSKLKGTPGIFSHRARIINYHPSSAPGQTNGLTSVTTFNNLLADIAAAANGSYITPAGTYYDAYTQSTLYDINMRDALRKVVALGAHRTAGYSVTLPLTGFTHSEHGIADGRYYSPSEFYTESGKYYGQFHTPDSLRIDYIGASGIASSASNITTVSTGDNNFRKTWNYYNNKELAAYGNTYKQEIIDSSIANRVMSDFTAFLALETGDTIKAMVGQNIAGPYPVGTPGSPKSGTLIAYPNPFRDQITIEWTEAMDELRVYDIGGSLVMSQKLSGAPNRWVWDGKGNDGRDLPAGMYLIRVSGNGHSTAIRVSKLGD